MSGTTELRSAIWRRPFAATVALTLLLAGVLPALHDHAAEEIQTHCLLSGLTTAPHFEPLELEQHEPCGVCAKSFSSARVERPRTALAEMLVDQQAPDAPQLLPPGPPGRHGASRAPPAA